MKWFGRDRDSEIREEIESHLAMREEYNAAQGVAGGPIDARKRFGNIVQVHEETRRMHISVFRETVSQDLRYAVRTLGRSRALTAAAMVAIALGIGSSTAVFSVVDRILFRSLPYPNADQLVSVGMAAPIEPAEFLLGPDYGVWKRSQNVFSAMTSWSGTTECDLTPGTAVRLLCARVEWDLLTVLGVHPRMGRNFREQEDNRGSPKAAILSHAAWVSRFASDPNILQRNVRLDGQPTQIVGVLPAEFELPTLNAFDVLIPQQVNEPAPRQGSMSVVRAFARLRPGVHPAQAQTALRPVFEKSLENVPAAFRKEVSWRVRPLRDRQIQEARAASWMLLGAVTLVLLIACANVANLLLARGAWRKRELAMRAALGASRVRLIRQTLTESLVLSAAGGIAGLGMAQLLLVAFRTLAPAGIPRLEQASLDLRVVLFALAATALAGLLFGILPALQSPAPESLAGWRTAGQRRPYARQMLVTAQIAVSLILTCGAALLMRSLWNLENERLGAQMDHVIAATVVLGQQAYGELPKRQRFFESLEDYARAMKGVQWSALSDSIPPAGRTRAMIYSLIEVEGRLRTPEGTGGMVVWRSVTPGYFQTLSIPILEGRPFQEADRHAAEPAMVLSEALKRRLFGEKSPLGVRIRVGGNNIWHQVVGVAGDVKNGGLAARPDPEYYVVRRAPDIPRQATLLVRTNWTDVAMTGILRAQIASIDPSLPVTIEPMRQRVRQLAQRPRFNAVLLAFFALTGVILAATGLYGVIAFLTAQRTQEIGVRIAMGAAPWHIVRQVITSALPWIGLGIAIGVGGVMATTRYLRTMLYQVGERDTATLLIAVTVLAAVSLLAAWLPSRRAARLDAMLALRQD